MTKENIVVIGGSAAGVTAAITARRHEPNKRILLIRREQKALIPCGIPYIFGTVGSPDKNLIPDAILEKNDIDLMIADATAIDPDARIVTTSEGPVSYDRLILATGSEPVRLAFPGADLDGVFDVRKDVDYLAAMQIRMTETDKIVIIGGGFIGIELADEFNKTGVKDITIIEIADHCLSLAYDSEFCQDMEQLLTDRGLHVQTKSAAAEIIGVDGHVTGVRLRDGSELPADAVIFGIGAKANVALAETAGLHLGPTGSVAVDRTMQTSDPAIFACGDCAEKISFFGGRPSGLKLASIAELEARIAGANLYGICRESVGTVGVWSTAVGPLALGTAGLTERAAVDMGYRIVCATVEGPNRHPGSMPGSVATRMKLVFESNSMVLLGGQISGGDSVGEMINIVAACVQKRMTAEEIATFQMGTHPALTASPIAYPLVNAAEMALVSARKAKSA
ncbi:MAG: FAD-dependent oxidoreductase [Pseudomonadota bacterium]|nr:FAD-dependent oxidoreductase [Pseudomonadota bacterium]